MDFKFYSFIYLFIYFFGREKYFLKSRDTVFLCHVIVNRRGPKFFYFILKAVLFEKFVYKRELEEHQKSLEMSGYIEGMVVVVVDLSCG